jgi:hypothetical protein
MRLWDGVVGRIFDRQQRDGNVLCAGKAISVGVSHGALNQIEWRRETKSPGRWSGGTGSSNDDDRGEQCEQAGGNHEARGAGRW